MSQVTYQIDSAHSAAHFSVRHMMISNVRGDFTKVSGTLLLDAANPANSSVTALIDAASLNTREPQRDTHLKSADFFDVEKYPELAFRSKSVAPADDGELRVTGDLTIHGVTREVTLTVEGPTPEAKDPWGNQRIGATATTKINRKDFGLGWNVALEAGGVLVGEDIKISIDLEAIRQA
jgi:polyisoprenoid-binding protein YceI